jgi:integrase
LRLPLGASGPTREERARALPEEELARLVQELPDDCRLLIRFLADTGLRIGECVALRWEHVDLGTRRVSVRERRYKGTVDEPKSRHGRRDVPLSPSLARELWRQRKSTPFAQDADPVFASRAGTPLLPENVFRRVLRPAAERAGVPWAGFHTLRHTAASRFFRAGWNAKQVQRVLGHHKASFTLDTYVHLMPEDLPDPGFLDALPTSQGVTRVSPRAGESGRNRTRRLST